jgi:hypothetical protein
MTAVASEGTPVRHQRLRERLRAAVLGPRGGGTTRRRASDAFRLGFAIVVVAVSIPVMRAVAAVLIQRLFTAYLPLVWGFATLTWMRRREYV